MSGPSLGGASGASTGSCGAPARRRSREAAAAPPRAEPFDAEPAEITRRALQIAEARSGLAVPAVDAERLAEVAGAVDDNADFVAPILAGLLRQLPRVAAGAGADPARMEAVDGQRAEMGDLRISATQLRRDVMDTRRGASAELRRQGRAVLEHIRGQLQPGRLPRAEQELLRSDAGELLAAWEELTRGPQEERDRTLAEGLAHEEQLAAEKDEQLMLETMLSLSSGAEVDQEAWDRAAEAYDALQARNQPQGSGNRRGRAR